MDINLERIDAFKIIVDEVYEELITQKFGEPEELKDDSGKAVIMKTEAVAYSVIYHNKAHCFELRTTQLDTDGKPGDWKSLSRWLFDLEIGTVADAKSIGADFVDIIKGPKMIADIKSITKPKKKKNEDGDVDPLFLFNRFITIFPEMKDTVNTEKIVFGKVRYATVTKEVLAPKCEELAVNGGEHFDRLCEILNDMYRHGDLEVRGIIIHGILNNLSDEALDKISPNFKEHLAKTFPYSKKLKGKNIKPNKPKKMREAVAVALDNANKNAGK